MLSHEGSRKDPQMSRWLQTHPGTALSISWCGQGRGGGQGGCVAAAPWGPGSCQHEGCPCPVPVPSHHRDCPPTHQPCPSGPSLASPSAPGLTLSPPCRLCSAPHRPCGTRRAAREDPAGWPAARRGLPSPQPRTREIRSAGGVLGRAQQSPAALGPLTAPAGPGAPRADPQVDFRDGETETGPGQG